MRRTRSSRSRHAALLFGGLLLDVGEAPAVGRQLGIAVSEDGIEWQRLDGDDTGGAIVAQAPTGSKRWAHRLGYPWAVPMDDGSIRLYYIGSNERPAGQGHAELLSVHQIGLAVSDGDLTRWRRWQGDAPP